MTVFLPRDEVRELLALARELALAMDADRNVGEDYLEVRLLRAVERVEQRLSHIAPHDGADVGPRRVDAGEDGR